MIARLWHGWTTPENADIYENLLKTEIFPGIAAKGVAGYRGIRLLRRAQDEEVEFFFHESLTNNFAISKHRN